MHIQPRERIPHYDVRAMGHGCADAWQLERARAATLVQTPLTVVQPLSQPAIVRRADRYARANISLMRRNPVIVFCTGVSASAHRQSGIARCKAATTPCKLSVCRARATQAHSLPLAVHIDQNAPDAANESTTADRKVMCAGLRGNATGEALCGQRLDEVCSTARARSLSMYATEFAQLSASPSGQYLHALPSASPFVAALIWTTSSCQAKHGAVQPTSARCSHV